MISTIIFDLDGLLADTEPIHCRAYQDVLAAHGVSLREEEYIDHWVRTGRGIVDWIELHGLKLDPHEIRSEKSRRYLELVSSSLRPMEGAIDLLEALRGKKTLALASSSYRDAVEAVLNGLNVRTYFAAVLSGLDVAAVKPAPDIFLAAAGGSGSRPDDCLVIEDAEK